MKSFLANLRAKLRPRKEQKKKTLTERQLRRGADQFVTQYGDAIKRLAGE